MNESMIERVARAAREAVRSSPDRNVSFEEMSIIVARAVIGEMRNIPFEVEAAGVIAAINQVEPFADKIEERYGFGEKSAILVACGDGRLYRAWHNAVIDAALNEQVAG